jgi:hypothetical protein
MMIGKETKTNFPYFAPMFQFFDECSCHATNPFQDKGWKPFDVKTNCDMAATWRGCAKGGGAKIKLLPCHCCSIVNEELIKANDHLCAKWCQGLHTDDPDWKCYHRSIDDEEKLTDWMSEVKALKEMLLVDLSEISESKMSCKKTDNHTANPRSIYFEPTTTVSSLEVTSSGT